MRRAVKRLVRHGRLAYGSNHLVMPVAPAAVSSPAIGRATSQEKNSRRLTAAGRAPKRPPQGLRQTSGGGNRVLGVFQRTQKGFGFVRLRERSAGRGS